MTAIHATIPEAVFPRAELLLAGKIQKGNLMFFQGQIKRGVAI
jgi:hypothetical protein